MSKPIYKAAHIVAILPFFATSAWPSPMITPIANVSSMEAYAAVSGKWTETETASEKQAAQKREVRKIQAMKIDAYFRARGMPLAGFGEEMVMAAEEHELDWRLLPAIAVRESSGGKQMCGHNPFGWASCRVRFESMETAINTVARNLGGNNPNTKSYYSGDTREKLHHYNGTVIPTYVSEVVAIMDTIEKQELK